MFQNLSSKLQSTFDRLRGKGKLTEEDVAAAMREVRLALLEADVNFKVVKEFVSRVRERAVGQDILNSLTASQHVVKIVHEELVRLLGDTAAPLNLPSEPGKPAVILIAGLQGGGKTTTCGKLALTLRKRGRKPLLAACDVYRPAAIKQLQVVGASAGIPVFTLEGSTDPVRIANEAVEAARRDGCDVVILDTAGRLHVDDALMEEVARIQATTRPDEVLLVVDAMTGQDAVNVAEAFNARLAVDGFVLTKLDSDTRGGAALSLRAVTDKPIKFAGTSEKLDGLEPFHPDRLASRILGMGDVLSLIERAEAAFDEQQAAAMEDRLRKNQFNFEDFLAQLRNVQKMGPLDQVLSMIPGFSKATQFQGVEIDQNQIKRQEAIVLSMTREERRNPELINGSRRRRIASGSGTSVQEVNRLLSQFQQMRAMVRQISDVETGKRRRGPVSLPFMR